MKKTYKNLGRTYLLCAVGAFSLAWVFEWVSPYIIEGRSIAGIAKFFIAMHFLTLAFDRYIQRFYRRAWYPYFDVMIAGVFLFFLIWFAEKYAIWIAPEKKDLFPVLKYIVAFVAMGEQVRFRLKLKKMRKNER